MEKNINALPEKQPVGYWWNDTNINVYEIGGKYYAADGWNGEKYEDSFEAENLNLDSIEEGTDEWDEAVEIVDYRVDF